MRGNKVNHLFFNYKMYAIFEPLCENNANYLNATYVKGSYNSPRVFSLELAHGTPTSTRNYFSLTAVRVCHFNCTRFVLGYSELKMGVF